VPGSLFFIRKWKNFGICDRTQPSAW